MVASNSGVDFITAAKMAGQDPAELLASPEFKEWLLQHLAESSVTVTFTKKDGSDRVMHCTRSNSLIPADSHPKGEGTAVSTDAIAAFDLEIGQWRSFNLSTVKRIDWNLEDA